MDGMTTNSPSTLARVVQLAQALPDDPLAKLVVKRLTLPCPYQQAFATVSCPHEVTNGMGGVVPCYEVHLWTGCNPAGRVPLDVSGLPQGMVAGAIGDMLYTLSESAKWTEEDHKVSRVAKMFIDADTLITLERALLERQKATGGAR